MPPFFGSGRYVPANVSKGHGHARTLVHGCCLSGHRLRSQRPMRSPAPAHASFRDGIDPGAEGRRDGPTPSRVPQDAVAAPAFDAYVARHNDAVRIGYCVDSEAYKARAMKDEMSSVARAIMATCKEGNEPDTLATVLKYRNCAAGNKVD